MSELGLYIAFVATYGLSLCGVISLFWGLKELWRKTLPGFVAVITGSAFCIGGAYLGCVLVESIG